MTAEKAKERLKMKKIAITHSEYGIYIGQAIGLGFWSKLDSAGKDKVIVFDTVEDAKEFLLSEFKIPLDAANYEFPEVEVLDEWYADIEELRAAGLGDLLGKLETGETVGMKI